METIKINGLDNPVGRPNNRNVLKKRLFIALGIIVLLLLTWVSYSRYYVGRIKPGDNTSASQLNPFRSAPQKKIQSPINGALVTPDEAQNHPVAVMVENYYPDARPQSGLINASVVYEAITEGGITRFMAIFGPNSSPEIGPVRSARSFFLDWASEYNAYYAHAGGAADALINIPKSNVYDLPHTTGYFKRISRGNVASEHTLYTDTNSLYRLAKVKKYPSKINVKALSFKDEAKTEDRGLMNNININFSTAGYLVDWKYNKEKNDYLRSMAQVPHKDRTTSQQIKAKTIITQEVARRDIHLPGAKATFQFTTIGSGKATVYQDGKSINGTWKKTSQKDRTIFLDVNNQEIEINRGIIWYEIVPPGTVVTSS